jgi:hypothetical protein
MRTMWDSNDLSHFPPEYIDQLRDRMCKYWPLFQLQNALDYIEHLREVTEQLSHRNDELLGLVHEAGDRERQYRPVINTAREVAKFYLNNYSAADTPGVVLDLQQALVKLRQKQDSDQ